MGISIINARAPYLELSDNLKIMGAAATEPYVSLSGPGGDRNVPLLGASSWKLGRASQSSIVVDDELVSRVHAMIQRTDAGEYYLIDMGSRNGSFVNDKRVSTPVTLKDGDRLSIGHARIVFHNPLESANTFDGTAAMATVCSFTYCMVSVLVVDIRGFTVLSQNIDHEALCKLTGGWFGEADRIMSAAGSVSQKYIGDAVMAVWKHGAEGGERLEIVAILRALLEFARATQSLGERLNLPGGLRIGAGLNTGMANVGNTGTSQVVDYTAMGESVNAAFRLESATKDLKTDVCLGKATSDFLRFWPRATACLKETEVVLKGYATPVQACPATFAQLSAILDSPELTPQTETRR
jgi:adenylate cyclase